MASEDLSIDSNSRNIAGGVTDDSNQFIKRFRIDDTTKGLKVSIVGGGGTGTVTSVSVVTANGISGVVATPTTTPAITLTLGNITPSAIQVSGLTASQILSTDASKNLTSLDTATYPSLTELSYVKGVTSAIQTQINSKGTGTVTAVSVATANGFSGSSSGGATPALTIVAGAITPTTVNGLTITANGTNTLSITAGKTLSVVKTISFTAADDTGVYTLPTGTKTLVATDVATLSSLTSVGSTLTVATGYQIGGAASSGKILKANGTNFVASTETYAAPGTSGNVMTSDGTNWTSSAPTGGTPTVMLSTAFETQARFILDGGNSGTVGFDTNGLNLQSTNTTTRYVQVQMTVDGNTSITTLGLGSPTFSCGLRQLASTNASAAGSTFFGLSDSAMTVSGAGHTYTTPHAGFKLLTVAGVTSVYATQGNAAETASSALTTVTSNDALELIMKINSTTSIDYYWRKNGGALSSATNLTTNLPSTGMSVMQFSVSNNSTAFNNQQEIGFASYSR